MVLTFFTLAEKSVIIFRMLLVSAKSLQMNGSSAQITLMDKPGPAGHTWTIQHPPVRPVCTGTDELGEPDGVCWCHRGFLSLTAVGGWFLGGELTWERVSGHDLLRQAQLPAQSSDLVLVEVLQRLDDLSLGGERQGEDIHPGQDIHLGPAAVLPRPGACG